MIKCVSPSLDDLFLHICYWLHLPKSKMYKCRGIRYVYTFDLAFLLIKLYVVIKVVTHILHFILLIDVRLSIKFYNMLWIILMDILLIINDSGLKIVLHVSWTCHKHLIDIHEYRIAALQSFPYITKQFSKECNKLHSHHQ